MISQLLDASSNKLLIPVVVVLAAAPLVRGLFSLYRSRSQDRKEFLELWRADHPDDLWLEVVVRHMFGVYLPAGLIRSLRSSPQAGRALLEISQSWPLLEMHDETSVVSWRSERHATSAKRRWWVKVCNLGYFVAMGSGLWIGLKLVLAQAPQHPILWVYPVVLALVGLLCLSHADRLKVADRAVPRWLGLS